MKLRFESIVFFGMCRHTLQEAIEKTVSPDEHARLAEALAIVAAREQRETAALRRAIDQP